MIGSATNVLELEYCYNKIKFFLVEPVTYSYEEAFLKKHFFETCSS